MAVIEIGKELYLENVISLRKKLKQEEINNEFINIERFMQLNGVKKTSPIVTTTHSIDYNGIIDFEILISIDRSISNLTEYQLKPIFRIVNAVYARHEGNPALLQDVYNEMTDFIMKNNMRQITPGYNVMMQEVTPTMNLEDFIIDVYIGVSENIL
ncbi:MAG: AraC family transcriptional regulator [Bacillota bacterium]